MNTDNDLNKDLDSLRAKLVAEIFEPRKRFLIGELSKFLKQERYLIDTRYDAASREYVRDKNFDSIKVLEFEYDQPMDFRFIGYASSFTDDDWNGTVIIEPEDDGFLDEISDVLSKFNPDFTIFGTDLETRFRTLKTELVRDYFSFCWIEAKKLTGSAHRCFLSEHNLSNYYDCDNSVESTESDIIQLRG